MLFIEIFKTSNSQTVRARVINLFRELSSHNMCHVSAVTCHMSRVICHPLFFLKRKKVVDLVGEHCLKILGP